MNVLFTAIGAVLVLALLVFVFGIIPIASIWALNTLFGLGIPYTLKTWFAALLLGGALTARGASK